MNSSLEDSSESGTWKSFDDDITRSVFTQNDTVTNDDGVEDLVNHAQDILDISMSLSNDFHVPDSVESSSDEFTDPDSIILLQHLPDTSSDDDNDNDEFYTEFHTHVANHASGMSPPPQESFFNNTTSTTANTQAQQPGEGQ